MQTLYRQQMQKEKALRRIVRREDVDPNSAGLQPLSPEVDIEYVRQEQGRLDRERRQERRINRLGEQEGDFSDTVSGRQKNRPKYLNDYDQGANKDASNDDDDEFEEQDYDDEDDDAGDDSDEEEYVHGRSKATKRAHRGGR